MKDPEQRSAHILRKHFDCGQWVAETRAKWVDHRAGDYIESEQRALRGCCWKILNLRTNLIAEILFSSPRAPECPKCDSNGT